MNNWSHICYANGERHERLLPINMKCSLCGHAAPLEDNWLNGGGGHKFDAEKPRMDLLDAEAIVELSKVLTFGAKKYAAHNWRKGIAISRLLAALSRHVFAMLGGEDKDPETGLDHAAHAMCCCMFVIWTLRHKPELDDRWKA